MSEKLIYLEGIEPVQIYGINDTKLDCIKKYFPKIKIIARGNRIKAIGEEIEINKFEEKINLLIFHFEKYNNLTENHIERLMTDDREEIITNIEESPADTLIYGYKGKPIRARTPNQRKMVEESSSSDLLFAVGPAGTGKTYTAIALAVKALKNKEVKRIILSRPAVEAGEHLGYLPGDLREKLDPYLQPLYDALFDMIPPKKLEEFFDEGIIQIAPLAFMRGRTLNDAFVILDEAQNATVNQIKMFLTRMGEHSKFMVTGDLTQIDLPDKHNSGLWTSINILEKIQGISVIHFDSKDIIRHKLVKSIVKAFSKNDN